MRERLGIEVASALLFTDLGVDELPQKDVEYEGRAQQVIERLMKACKGEPLPEAGPWMSDLARRAQDRLTMGTVVAETQATLREIEQKLDRFFREPGERADLPATTAMFDQVSRTSRATRRTHDVLLRSGAARAQPSAEKSATEDGST